MCTRQQMRWSPRGVHDLETNRSSQIQVRPTLQASKVDRIFVVGDCASLTLPGNEAPLAPTAQVATQQAEHLARHLPRWLAGDELSNFTFHDLRSLVSLSDNNAFWHARQFRFLPRRTHSRTLRAVESLAALSTTPAGPSWLSQGDPSVDGRANQLSRATEDPHDVTARALARGCSSIRSKSPHQ